MANKVIKKFTKSPSINHLEVIPQLVEKHNILANSHNSSTEQINGLFESFRRELDTINNKNGQLDSKLKNLIFCMNRINIENEVLRKELYKSSITNPQIIKDNVDEIMKHDLGVDSNLKPTGVCKITKYNC